MKRLAWLLTFLRNAGSLCISGAGGSLVLGCSAIHITLNSAFDFLSLPECPPPATLCQIVDNLSSFLIYGASSSVHTVDTLWSIHEGGRSHHRSSQLDVLDRSEVMLACTAEICRGTARHYCSHVLLTQRTLEEVPLRSTLFAPALPTPPMAYRPALSAT